MLRARQLSRSRRSTGGPSIRGSWASWWRFEPALNGRRPPPRRRPPPPRPPPPTRGVRPNEAIPWPFGCELITTALQPARRHAATLPRAAAAPSRRTRSFPASPTSPRDVDRTARDFGTTRFFRILGLENASLRKRCRNAGRRVSQCLCLLCESKTLQRPQPNLWLELDNFLAGISPIINLLAIR